MEIRELGAALRGAASQADSGSGTRGAGSADFAALLGNLVADANRAQLDASDKARGLAKGDAGIVETVLALDKADISLKMVMAVRDRAIEAYQTIMRSL